MGDKCAVSRVNAAPLESQVKHCTGRKPVSSLPLQIYTCIHSYVEFFHASIIKLFPFPCMFCTSEAATAVFSGSFVLWAEQNQERRKRAFISSISAPHLFDSDEKSPIPFSSLFFSPLTIGVPRTPRVVQSTVALRAGLHTSTSGIGPRRSKRPLRALFPADIDSGRVG